MKPRRHAGLWLWAVLLSLSTGALAAPKDLDDNPMQRQRRAWGVYYQNGPGRFNFGLVLDPAAMIDMQVAFDQNFTAGLSWLPDFLGYTAYAAGINFYSYEPYAGFWANLYYYYISFTGSSVTVPGLGGFALNATVHEVTPRIGWCWHAMAHRYSFAISAGPAITVSPAFNVPGISARIQLVGIDFWLDEIFN